MSLEEHLQHEPVLSRVVAAVDDDPFMLRALGRALTHASYRVMLFDNPWTALSGLGPMRVDAVILDREMPGCSGPSLASRLQERWGEASPPMILLSGNLHGLAPEEKALFAHIASKPIGASDLISMVRRTRRVSGTSVIERGPRS